MQGFSEIYYGDSYEVALLLRSELFLIQKCLYECLYFVKNRNQWRINSEDEISCPGGSEHLRLFRIKSSQSTQVFFKLWSPKSHKCSLLFICVYVWYVGAYTWVHAPMYAHTETKGGCPMSFLSLTTSSLGQYVSLSMILLFQLGWLVNEFPGPAHLCSTMLML